MRIISGKLKGKTITAPKGLPVRPTTDLAKEGLFNILVHEVDFENIDYLELFAGTGSILYEFYSRGTTNITAVDIDKGCIQFIRNTCEQLSIPARIMRCSANEFIKRCTNQYQVIFADPPYEIGRLEELPGWIFNADILSENGMLIIEHPNQYDFSKHAHFYKHKSYGKVNFTFFKKEQLETET